VIRAILVPCLLAAALGAQDPAGLPGWARESLRAAAGEQAPAGAEAWVLLDRTELTYAGGGNVEARRFRLVKVLTGQGTAEGTYGLHGLGGRTSRVRKLQGWNLRADGELVKLDTNDVSTATGTGGEGEGLTARTRTLAVLDRVAKGSLVAFESQETFSTPMGPLRTVLPMEAHPVRVWELTVAGAGGKEVPVRMETRHFVPWLKGAEVVPGRSVRAVNVPAIPKGEKARPYDRNTLPWVAVAFQDSSVGEVPLVDSWENVGAWLNYAYVGRRPAARVLATGGTTPLDRLRALHLEVIRQIAYKAVYLTPERGWIPEGGAEVFRKRYGDCKDLTSILTGEAALLGFEACPVLALIQGGRIEPDEPVSLYCFNHVISAIRLERTLGLDAEVETPAGRFLLVDPTDRFTPLGKLGQAHARQRMLICTPKGGIWTAPPAEAVLHPLIRMRLEAEAGAGGELAGTLRLQETGGALGLRQAARDRGPSGMKDYFLENVEDLPPTGALEVKSLGDPMDLERPFEMVVAFRHPRGVTFAAGEASLLAWGLPGALPPLQEAGKARRFPIEEGESQLTREFEASIRLPWSLAPVLPELQADSPFRTFNWKASAASRDGSTTVELRFSQTLRPVLFDAERLEEGLARWKKDRYDLKRVLSDGLAFKLAPSIN